MNISLHGLMRYFQRFDDKLIGNEDAFKVFKRDNVEACVSAEKEINLMANNENNIVFELTEKNNKMVYSL